jgi:3',5'-cyclic AMP phosphodiesterase CpdA
METGKQRSLSASLIVIFFLIGACSSNRLQYDFNGDTGAALPYPDVSFAVISDIHIYDTSLGSSGEAFEKALNSDRKLLLNSAELLDYAIRDLIASDVKFVLISGDLTKDGELINHLFIAEKLKKLKEAGIAVYVVPGNHDINNPGALSYSGANTAPVPSIRPEEFAFIYGEFGFNSALMRDDDSLSYVAEPVSGLWLLCLDACRYRENESGKEEIVSGRFNKKTAEWIAGALEAARDKRKAVITMMHHGVVEHWKGQAKLHPDYLVNDYAGFGKFLSSWNVRLVFTGHYHAQDITLGTFGDKFIYDIETGSLVTAPCPIRFAEIKNNVLQIRSDTIVDKIHGGTDFADNATAFVRKTVVIEAETVLRNYRVSPKDAAYIAGAVGDGFVAHYSGDENPSLRPTFDPSRLGLWGRFVYGLQKYALEGLWQDLPPSDNNVRIEL